MNDAAAPRSEAPGAKGSRICGIFAIVSALTCIGIPVGIILGIVALVQQAKAKRLAMQFPNDYLPPTSSGLVLGIIGLVMPVVMLPFAGIVSAIAIPALLGQRARAREKVVVSALQNKLPELAERYGHALETGTDAMTVRADLESFLRSTGGDFKNPFKPETPAFSYTVAMTTAATEEGIAAAAQDQAMSQGEIVFVMSAPTDPQAPRFVAGAVRTTSSRGGTPVFVKVMRVD